MPIYNQLINKDEATYPNYKSKVGNELYFYIQSKKEKAKLE